MEIMNRTVNGVPIKQIDRTNVNQKPTARVSDAMKNRGLTGSNALRSANFGQGGADSHAAGSNPSVDAGRNDSAVRQNRGTRGRNANRIIMSESPGIAGGRRNHVSSMLSDVFGGSADARAEAQSMFGRLSTVFGHMTAVSSNDSVVSVVAYGTMVPPMAIEVNQLAQTQVNEGEEMANGDRDIPAGTHTFEIMRDGHRRVITITTDTPLTNRDFQQRMADEINRSGIGITATVETDGGTSALRLETQTTGARGSDGQRFTIRDLGGSAVRMTGINNVTQYAQDAELHVNGFRVTNPTNIVDFLNGMKIELHRTTRPGEVIKIGFALDLISIEYGIDEWVDDINAILQAGGAKGASDEERALAFEMRRLLEQNRQFLEQIGITFSDDLTVSVDSGRLETAVKDGVSEDVVARLNGGGSFDVTV